MTECQTSGGKSLYEPNTLQNSVMTFMTSGMKTTKPFFPPVISQSSKLEQVQF